MAVQKLLVATPTMGGIMKSRTATALIALTRALTKRGIDVVFWNIDASDIVYARNRYAQALLDSHDFDALLFVDSDMWFRPSLVLRMLTLGVKVAAAAYPKRGIDMSRVSAALAEGDSLAKAMARGSDFTVLRTWDANSSQRVRMRKGFASMAAAGMGCALITKTALLDMIEAGIVEKKQHIQDGQAQDYWSFFTPLAFGNMMLSEDYSFWHRWTHTMGRELWVCVDEPVEHIGSYNFDAKYDDLLAKTPPQGPANAEPLDTAAEKDAAAAS